VEERKAFQWLRHWMLNNNIIFRNLSLAC